jgi:hypothetical protein
VVDDDANHLGNCQASEWRKKYDKEANESYQDAAYQREKDRQTDGNGEVVPGGSVEDLLLFPNAFLAAIPGFSMYGTAGTDRAFTPVTAQAGFNRWVFVAILWIGSGSRHR